MSSIQQNRNPMLVVFLCFLVVLTLMWVLFGCKTTRLDHVTGDRNPTWNKRHLDIVHKNPWHAGKNLITPAGFTPIKTPVKATVKK